MTITVTESKRLIKNPDLEQFTCDECGRPATHSCVDQTEVPSTDPEGWREFKERSTRYGCADHHVAPIAYYLDGRELLAEHCVPEKCLPEERFKPKRENF